jgi:predicted ATP-grasp superfamily ATP-dependent carboligase
MAGPPALILGRGLTALGVLRLLGRRGIDAYVWPPATDMVRRSRWYRPAPEVGLDPEADLAGFLGVLPLERAVVIPTSDAWAMALAGLGEAPVTARFPACVPARTVLETLVDKRAFADVLRAAGLPHPLTVPVAAPGDLVRVPDDVIPRAFLKPHDSQRFFARFGVKAFRVASREEAEHRIETLAREGIGVVVQEYIPGPASEHYFVDGFADREGGVLSAFGRRRLRMYPPDFGNSTCMVSVPPAEVADGLATIERLTSLLGYHGIFSAEFKRDPRDGRLKLLEVNARPWWYVEFAGRCGVDVVAQYYDDALGRPLRRREGYAVGRELMFPYYDYHAVTLDGPPGVAALAAWAWRAARAVQPVWCLDDPWPALSEVAAGAVRRLTRSRKAAA